MSQVPVWLAVRLTNFYVLYVFLNLVSRRPTLHVALEIYACILSGVTKISLLKNTIACLFVIAVVLFFIT